MKSRHLISIAFLLAVLSVLTGYVLGGSSDQKTYGTGNKRAGEVKNIPGLPFAWPFKPLEDFQPRGGTTRGTEVTLADQPSDRWSALQEDDLSKKERDRRAILAMAGSYRVSFQFIETMGFKENYQPPKPYFSWATEHIHVVKSKENLIRMQHVLVMYFRKNGEVRGPHVMKHWRQDWSYEDQSVLTYSGNRTWNRKQLDPDRARGSWTQTVYQVDDAPRYEAVGRWEHHDQFSIWKSDAFKRPLPRREFSVRDDYDLLKGTNTISITPDGWVHEQTNAKVRLSEDQADGKPDERIIARETGINRYERITEPNLSGPASEYWNKTSPFWTIVREEWQSALSSRKQFRLGKQVNGKKLHRHLFKRAETLRQNEDKFDADRIRSFVSDLLEKYVHSVESP